MKPPALPKTFAALPLEEESDPPHDLLVPDWVRWHFAFNDAEARRRTDPLPPERVISIHSRRAALALVRAILEELGDAEDEDVLEIDLGDIGVSCAVMPNWDDFCTLTDEENAVLSKRFLESFRD